MDALRRKMMAANMQLAARLGKSLHIVREVQGITRVM